MGLLKKKTDDAAGAELEPIARATAPDETSPVEAVAGGPTQAGADAGALAEAAVADATPNEADAAPAGTDAVADGSEALLNMFASSQAASDDRGLLVGLAGEVEVADLVDQARTLAAAMNIALATD
jgi:hypothetical protein